MVGLLKGLYLWRWYLECGDIRGSRVMKPGYEFEKRFDRRIRYDEQSRIMRTENWRIIWRGLTKI